jgi:hypothetical protein
MLIETACTRWHPHQLSFRTGLVRNPEPLPIRRLYDTVRPLDQPVEYPLQITRFTFRSITPHVVTIHKASLVTGTEKDRVFVQDCHPQMIFIAMNKTIEIRPPAFQVRELKREYTFVTLLWLCVWLLFMYEYIDTKLTLNVK